MGEGDEFKGTDNGVMKDDFPEKKKTKTKRNVNKWQFKDL